MNLWSSSLVKGYQMQIKAPSRNHIIRARQRRLGLAPWLTEVKTRTMGRLKQLNKHNRRVPSELVQRLINQANEART